MFAHFLENTGVHTDDREFGISLDDYYGGCFLTALDRTPDKCNRYHRHKIDSGTIDLNLKTNAHIMIWTYTYACIHMQYLLYIVGSIVIHGMDGKVSQMPPI